MRGCNGGRNRPGRRCDHGYTLPSHVPCFPPCSCPDKPLRIRIAWLPGSTCADLPVLPPESLCGLVVQTGGLAEHAVNPGQDVAQSLSLHLGKMEAEAHLGFALIWVCHADGLYTWGHKNEHTLSAYTVTKTDFFCCQELLVLM